jgi:hypothetical protein
MRSWFEGRRFPLDVAVGFWLDGAPTEPRVASRLHGNGAMSAGLGPAMRRLAGRTVWGLRLAAAGTHGAASGGGRAEVDVLLTRAARGGGTSGGGTSSGDGSSDGGEEDGSGDSGSGKATSSKRDDGNGGDSDIDGGGGGSGSGRAAPGAVKRTVWRELLDEAGRRVLEGGVSAGRTLPARELEEPAAPMLACACSLAEPLTCDRAAPSAIPAGGGEGCGPLVAAPGPLL